MKSQREIEKKYKKLMEDVATNDFYKVDLTNRVNCYVCSCRHITKTKDVDAGVTPFLSECEACGQMAQSTMYRDIAPEQQPTIEWFRPPLNDVLKMRNKPMLLDHILSGGLESRKIVPSKDKQMTIVELNDEAMYCLFAPDGSFQGLTLAPDMVTCAASIKMLHKAGLSKSLHQLSLAGYKILPVKVTMTQST